MDTFEIFNLITSQPKWYAGIRIGNGFMSAQAANRIKARFNNCTLSKRKIERIFNHFGYYLEENWIEHKNDKIKVA